MTHWAAICSASGQTRRSDQGRLARWPGGLPVHEKIGTREVHLAFRRRWRGGNRRRSFPIYCPELTGARLKKPGVQHGFDGI